jgi:hypothetical protein
MFDNVIIAGRITLGCYTLCSTFICARCTRIELQMKGLFVYNYTQITGLVLASVFDTLTNSEPTIYCGHWSNLQPFVSKQARVIIKKGSNSLKYMYTQSLISVRRRLSRCAMKRDCKVTLSLQNKTKPLYATTGF